MSPSEPPMPSAGRSMTAIVAATRSNGIGKNGTLPWRLSGEMKYFARVTTGENLPEGSHNAVIMGRKTWESIPPKFRPLKSRHNVVISRQDLHLAEQLTSSSKSLSAALSSLPSNTNRTFLIGGSQLYDLALDSNTATSSPIRASGSSSDSAQTVRLVDRVLLTRITQPDFECDTFLTPFHQHEVNGRKVWKLENHAELCRWVGWDVPSGEQEEKGVRYHYEMWVRT